MDPAAKQPQQAYLEAYNTSDFVPNPEYALVLFDENLGTQLKKLQQLCKDNDLTEVRVSSGPAEWAPLLQGGDEVIDDGLHELVVTPTQFWFNVDFDTGKVQTRSVDVDDFMRTMANADQPQFFGCFPALLREAIFSNGDAETASSHESETESMR